MFHAIDYLLKLHSILFQEKENILEKSMWQTQENSIDERKLEKKHDLTS